MQILETFREDVARNSMHSLKKLRKSFSQKFQRFLEKVLLQILYRLLEETAGVLEQVTVEPDFREI